MIKNSIVACVLLSLPLRLLAMDSSSKALLSTLNKRLLAAAQTGTPLAIEALLNAGAPIAHVDHASRLHVLLRVAITHHNILTALYLIDQVPDINTPDNAGDTLLHVVSEKPQNSKVLEALLRRGACLENCNMSMQRPLAVACNFGNIAAIKMLIEAGADTNIMVDDKTPRVALDLLVLYMPRTISPTPRIPLFTALEHGKPSVIEAVVTSITPQEVRHILPSCILFTHRKIACGSKDIGKIIMAKVIQEVICTKLLIARAYLPDDPEDALRAAIIESIKRVITKSPRIQKSQDPE